MWNMNNQRVLLASMIWISAISCSPSLSSAASVTYACDFPRWSDNTGTHPSKQKFSMKFAYDTITKEAFMIGNGGVSNVVAVNGDEGITFLERLPTGAVQTTTIIMSGAAVHSRHSIMFDELTPSQYYGRCAS